MGDLDLTETEVPKSDGTSFLVKVYIVEERNNPSTDYFVLPQFTSRHYQVVQCRFDQVPSSEALKGAIVVFVRYLPSLWRRSIAQNRTSLQALYYFMDDDLLDGAALNGMPWGYRWKIFSLALRHANWLEKMKPVFWVSSDYLKHKYSRLNAVKIFPKRLEAVQNPVRVFYHGSITHHAEIKWLLKVVEQVLEQAPNVYFEFIGNAKVNRMFLKYERVQVMNLMPWKAYQQFIQQPGRHIGLVPLLPNPFNLARSETKVFDIQQAGAVGIYAANSVCSDLIEHNKNGVVLPMDQDQWIREIVDLARSPERLSTLIQTAQLSFQSPSVSHEIKKNSLC